MSIRRELEIYVLDEIGKQFSSSKLRKAGEAVGREIIEIIRERTIAGVDIYGKPFEQYSRGYEERKRKAISGISPKRIRGRIVRAIKKLFTRKSQFAARSVADWMRASGQMFEDMTFSIQVANQGRSGIYIRILLKFKNRRSAVIAEYHNIGGAGKSKILRVFFGLSVPGSPRHAREQERIQKVLLRELGLSRIPVQIRGR